MGRVWKTGLENWFGKLVWKIAGEIRTLASHGSIPILLSLGFNKPVSHTH